MRTDELLTLPALYPVFPSDRDAEQVIGWLNTHPA
jgi:hypothetical protein